MHRYFLKEFLDLGAGLITLEQWGVNGNKIDVDEFMNNYTRTQRLRDHKTVINHLLKNPPIGWNGKLIFVGGSEGVPLVTSLTIEYSDITIATVNWSGADDGNWRDEVWEFIKGISDEIMLSIPWHIRIRSKLPTWVPYSVILQIPKSKEECVNFLNETLKNPTAEKKFMGMTYMYHADVLNWPKTKYEKIKTPYLVVSGAKDTAVKFSDEFVEKAKKASINIDYMRVEDMDHYIRKRPDILEKSFDWIREILKNK